MDYEPVIGLEVHAELETEAKMFCPCPVVDSTSAAPNTAVCPICAGMPGVLPVVNIRAVEYALRVALALECEINTTSLFARKNYFYPDLPKGYQISQYEQPLACNGRLTFLAGQGERTVRIRRVHLEEDTGKLTHVAREGEEYSLVDLNRAGVPLLEIVTEPDLHTAEEVRAYAMALRSLLRYLGVNSGDMQKGILRIEPNVSVRPAGSQTLGTRTEIKNLNSFRALERSVAFEIRRQSEQLRQGRLVEQETRGWDEGAGATFSQRSKEEAHDYRYFPEPDLPPLRVETAWVERVRGELPELPLARQRRFQSVYGLSAYDSEVLTAEPRVADYFEAAVHAVQAGRPGSGAQATAQAVAHWITGDLFSLLNEAGEGMEAGGGSPGQPEAQLLAPRLPPEALAELVWMVERGEVNQTTAKAVLAEMFATGRRAVEIVASGGLSQVSDPGRISVWVAQVLDENPGQVDTYLKGKESVVRWLFGQVMRATQGRANPQVVHQELDRQLAARKRDE